MASVAGFVGVEFRIHNRGTDDITLNSSGGSNDFYEAGVVTNSKTIAQGETFTFFNDGTYYLIY